MDDQKPKTFPEMFPEGTFFVHSRCCNAHWELVILPDGSAGLLCENCGRDIGPDVMVIVHSEPGECECEECRKEREQKEQGD